MTLFVGFIFGYILAAGLLSWHHAREAVELNETIRRVHENFVAAAQDAERQARRAERAEAQIKTKERYRT